MDNAVNIIKWTNPREPIRSALGNLGYSNLFQTLEPDLIRWCIEAQDLISRPRTQQEGRMDFEVTDNKIILCPDFLMLECVSIGNTVLTYEPNGSCDDMVTDSCPCRCACGEGKFTIDNCYMHFSPEQPDGTVVHIKYLKRKMGADGYPMVVNVCATAIIEYINMKVTFRERDNRYAECKAQWLIRCVQARMELKRLTQNQVHDIGEMWSPRHVSNSLYGGWLR